MTAELGPEWIHSRDLKARLAECAKGDKRQLSLMLEAVWSAASARLVQVWAEQVVTRTGAKDPKPHAGGELPQWYWDKFVAEKVVPDEWDAGLFRSWGYLDVLDTQTTIVELFGVRFQRASVEQLLGISFHSGGVVDVPGAATKKVASADAGIDGAKPIARSSPQPKWDWEGLLIDLLELSEAADQPLVCSLGLERHGGQAKLERWINDWFSERNKGRGPAPSEVRRRAQRIIQKLSPSPS